MTLACRPTLSTSLANWLAYLEQVHVKPIDLGLTRIRQVAQTMQLLTVAPTVFTVAGTNGKGTTCRTLEMILLAQGYRVGVYSSPHLLHYCERIRINNQLVSEQQVCQAFNTIEQQRGAITLTYFEFATLAALYLFKLAQLDVVILEVGLGGRLDATNIIDADVAVVTSIDLDHMHWLGNDKESIAGEKAGIFRANRPAVIGEPEPLTRFQQVIKQLSAVRFAYQQEWTYQQTGQTWQWQSAQQVYQHLPLPQVPLNNAATALAALSQANLVISEQAIITGLQQVSLPGRFQQVGVQPRLILDVAHNPHAARYLYEKLLPLAGQGRILLVIGMLADKDIASTLAILKPLVDDWYCASLQGERAASADQLASYLTDQPNVKQFADVVSAWQAAMQQANDADTVLVCGSFHTVGDVLAQLPQQQQDTALALPGENNVN